MIEIWLHHMHCGDLSLQLSFAAVHSNSEHKQKLGYIQMVAAGKKKGGGAVAICKFLTS